mgnify:CR=1 FL=1
MTPFRRRELGYALQNARLPYIMPHNTGNMRGNMVVSTAQPLPTAQELTRPDGTVDLDALLEGLRVSKTELASVLGMSRDAVSKTARLNSRASQRRLKDLVEILLRSSAWAGSIPQAFAWFTAQPLPSFGQQTAADLVREGRADAVKAHLSRITVGGFA